MSDSRRVFAVGAIGALAIVAALFVVGRGSASKTGTAHAAQGRLVGFRIAAPPVNNPDRPPSDIQQPGGVLGYAIHLGTFQQELARAGFEYLGLRGFPRTAACMLALATGQVEVASTGDSPALLSRARGDKHRAIYLTPPESETWVVARKGGPTSLRELAGKKVGTLFGSTFDYYFQVVVAKLGIAGIEYAQLQGPAALPALQKGALDAYLTPATTAALWQRKYGLPVIGRLSEVDPKLKGIGITTAREDFINANPGFPAAYYRALKTAIDAIQKDKEAYFAWQSDATGVPIDILRASEPLKFAETPIPEESVAALREMLEFRLKTNVANSWFDVREWVVEPEQNRREARSEHQR